MSYDPMVLGAKIDRVNARRVGGTRRVRLIAAGQTLSGEWSPKRIASGRSGLRPTLQTLSLLAPRRQGKTARSCARSRIGLLMMPRGRAVVPTIRRFNNCKIAIYADDHLPPHFHIEGRGFRAIVAMDTFETRAGDAHRAAEAIRWAKENIELLRTEWVRLNRRG